jgi:exopolysaccharide production protein ExoZ
MNVRPERLMIYGNVQAARALAALAVLAYHMGLLPFGQCGVDIFFVISGFIMSHVAPGDEHGFMRKRLIRIVPLYWLSTVGVYVIAVLRPNWLNTTTASVPYLVKSLLFIPFMKANGHWGPLNLNGWTLEYEMFFYLVIALAMTVIRPRFATAAAATALAVYSASICLLKPQNPVAVYLGQPFVLEFGLGVLSYWLVKSGLTGRISRGAWMTFAIVSVAMMPLYFHMKGAPTGLVRVGVYGIAAFVFMTALIAVETGGWSIRSSLISYLVGRLGAASYAIYLLHPYIVGMLRKLLTVQTNMSGWREAAIALIVITVVCVVGDACHVLVEKPILALLNHRFRRSRSHGVSPT